MDADCENSYWAFPKVVFGCFFKGFQLHASTNHNGRSPFSLLLGKSVGPNNFWFRQFEIVGVGVTIGPFVRAMFGKIHPDTNIFTMSGAKNCLPNHFVPTIGERCTGTIDMWWVSLTHLMEAGLPERLELRKPQRLIFLAQKSS